MAKKSRVTVVGSFAVGLTLRAPRFPVAGETLLASGFDQGPGGKGSNQAVQAARMGAEVEFVGIVGSDGFGDIGRALWDEEGVGTGRVRVRTASIPGSASLCSTRGARTGSCSIREPTNTYRRRTSRRPLR